MLQLHEYSLGEVVYSGPETRIFRAVHSPSGQLRIIKLPSTDTPSLRTIGRLVHEYRILSKLSGVSGIARAHALEQSGGTAALVLDDVAAQSLDKVLAGRGRLPVDVALRIGLGLCRVLQAVHTAGVMHKDLKPQNILVNELSTEVILIDFGIASELSQEATEACIPEALEGTLAYISPEQTGRTARAVDARTDLYSLGVTLFETLTGRRPFLEQDPLALVYAHLARSAPNVHELVPEVPKSVAAIIDKLLAKEPERRYQTAHGAGLDIEQALEQWLAQKGDLLFELGRKDFSPWLRLPQLLIGREREAEELAVSFERAAQGKVELLLIGGPSGIGKTALVRTVYRDIAKFGRGLLISGKHDQLARSTPYAAMAQAFGGLMRQWLVSADEILSSWRERIRQQVGDNARLIADVIPELDMVMGERLPAVPPVPGDMILNRQKITWLNFVGTVTQSNAPLVMFLDDMQWADSATLTMLQTLLTDSARRDMLVIAAYRNNETPPDHPLWKLVESVEQSGAHVSRIEVGPLKEEQVCHWLARTLESTEDRVRTLASALFQKTRGNPFFLEQLLLSLHRQKQVVRDLNSGDWLWNQQKIEQAQVTDNVVALLTDKVRQMPDATQEVLGLAACAGHKFLLHDLERLSGWDRARVVRSLWPALLDELIVPVDGAYRPAQALTGGVQGGLDAEYRFLHDRVQQASYERISPELRTAAHLEIGRRLWDNYQHDKGTAQELFELVRHLNLGAVRIEREEERKRLARLNLDAARSAKEASAYRLMANLLEHGQALLGEPAWQDEPTLMLELSMERLEAAYLLREFDDVEARANAMLAMPLLALTKLAIHEVRVRSCSAKGEYGRGLSIGLDALAEQGVTFPETEEEAGAALLQEATELDAWFAANPDAFDRMPADTSPEHQIIDAIMAHMAICAAVGNRPFLAALSIERNIRGTRDREAITLMAPFMIAAFVQTWSAVTSMYRRAADWATPGVSAARRVASPMLAECLYFRGAYAIYARPVDESAVLHEEAVAVGLKSGAFQGTGWASFGELFQARVWRGMPLDQVDAQLRNRWDLMLRAGDALGKHFFELTESWLKPLMNADGIRTLLSNHPLERGSRYFLGEGDGAVAQAARTVEAHLLLITGAFTQALAVAREAELFRPILFGVCPNCDVPLWLALAAAKCLPATSDPAEQAKLREELFQGLARLRYFAEGCPENFLHRQRLVEAECARALGKIDEAVAYYDEAITLARKERVLYMEALAAQFCAEFHLATGRKLSGGLYLRVARDAYARWGARSIVAWLEQKYAELLLAGASALPADGLRTITTTTTSTTSTASGSDLDLRTAIRAAQTLSSDLDVKRVVGKLMRLIQENAGAQHAALLLTKGDEVSVAALLSGSQIRADLLEPLSSSHTVAQRIVQLVVRSRESILLDDALADTRFAQDPYLCAAAIRSVLAVPLLHQGRLCGVIYLDHEAAHAFSPARVTLINILAAQSAIALENARLYAECEAANANLEAKVKERTAALDKALKELWSEMDLAQKIQTVLLPSNAQVSGYELAAIMRPTDQVGGDYYDVFRRNEQDWVLIGDVSGHGVPAGLCMMMIQTAIRATTLTLERTQQPLTPRQVLALVNAAVYDNLRQIGRHQYMTITALCITGETVRFAGLHQDLIVYRAASQKVERIETTGAWLGILEEISTMLEDDAITLAEGDVMLLYTDGITEAKIDGRWIETSGLATRFGELAKQTLPVASIIEGLMQSLKQAEVKDDVTLIAIRRHGASHESASVSSGQFVIPRQREPR